MVFAAVLCTAAAGCSGGSGESSSGTDTGSVVATEAAPAPGPSSAPTAGATPSVSSDAVPGYAVGEIPPIPMFALPDLSLLNASTGAFTPDLTRSITSVPGITVNPARCDEGGVFAGGTTVVGGDGSGNYTNGDKSVVNNGDGSGNYTEGDVSIVNNGDGSGNYTNSRTGVSMVNNGDGSGNYTDSKITIINHGDGTALVNGREVKADRLPRVERIGTFPPIDAVAPMESCGTVITLEDGILFDFGSSEVRSEADQTLRDLTTVLNDAGAPEAHVYGHTDSVSDDAFNQTLSEQRAQAVVDALTKDGTRTTLDATGFGETRPVAPNENPDGSDNPAGRQLNRRVEIFVPAF